MAAAPATPPDKRRQGRDRPVHGKPPARSLVGEQAELDEFAAPARAREHRIPEVGALPDGDDGVRGDGLGDLIGVDELVSTGSRKGVTQNCVILYDRRWWAIDATDTP